MKDEPPPATITPSYVPLWKKNEHWRDECKPTAMCNKIEFIQIYGQNNNGINDSTELKYDDTFKHMKEAEADIFCINESHANKMNSKNNTVLESSRQKMFQLKEGQYCNLVSLSSMAPITKYTKPGGTMMGITGPLISRIRRRVEDKYGRWCGLVLLGKDNCEILVLTAYNVPQDTLVGDDTLHAQQTSMYLLDGEINPHPRKNFI